MTIADLGAETRSIARIARQNEWSALCFAHRMEQTAEQLDELSEQIIGAAIEVHRHLGPGLLESIYRECLLMELTAKNLRVEVERRVPVHYKGRRIDHYLKLDLVVEGCIIVEVKSVSSIDPVHLAQVITYLKLANCPAGLLMNFNATTLRAGLRRLNHPDRHRPNQHVRTAN